MYSFVTVIFFTIATVLKCNIETVVAFQRQVRSVVGTSDDVCKTLVCNASAIEILNNMDNSVEPCDDFYKFSCGGFHRRTGIPDGDGETDYFTALDYEITLQLLTIIEEPMSADEPKYIATMKNLYKSCTNEAEIERRGVEPLQEKLRELGGWPVLAGGDWNDNDFDWIELVYKFRKVGYPTDYLLSLNIDVDLKDSTKKVLELDEPSLTIPREKLLGGINSRDVDAYYIFMVDIAVMLGASRYNAMVELEKSLKFEIALAKITLPSSEQHKQTLIYTSMTVAELSTKYPTLSWKKYINYILSPYVTIDDNEIVIVTVPQFLSEFVKLIDTTPKRDLANYMMWRATENSIGYLNEKMLKRLIEYRMELSDDTAPEPRRAKCLRELYTYIPAQAWYIRKHFHQATKNNTIEMITNIMTQFKKLIQMVDWMDKDTKKNAVDKAADISFSVGCPDEFFNETFLEEAYKNLQLNDDDYFENSLTIRRFDSDETSSRFRESIDESDLIDDAVVAIVNAYYFAETNSIQIPAGILQGVFFNENRPKYMNYGAIGSIIGHEIFHAFDDATQYDEYGNLVNWMTPASNEEYQRKVLCIINQYSNFTITKIDKKLDGSKTQDENIADNNGFKIAYSAYTDWLEKHGEEQRLPGLAFSAHQMFWISAANSLCSKYRPEYIEEKIAIDPHSPFEFQILGSFHNLPEFSDDFKCPPGSNMNPKDKCIFW